MNDSRDELVRVMERVAFDAVKKHRDDLAQALITAYIWITTDIEYDGDQEVEWAKTVVKLLGFDPLLGGKPHAE